MNAAEHIAHAEKSLEIADHEPRPLGQYWVAEATAHALVARAIQEEVRLERVDGIEP